MKCNKKFIVDMYRSACIQQQNLKEALNKIAQASYSGSESETIIDLKSIASQALITNP